MRKTTLFPLVIILSLMVSFLNIPTTKASPSYEDFSTYTEYDDDNKLSLVGTNHIDHIASRQTGDKAYIYFDYDVDAFGDFTHLVDVKSDFAVNYGMGFVWALSNDLDDWRALKDGGKTAIGVRFYRSGSYMLSLAEAYNNNQYLDTYTVSANTWYFLTIIKTGKNLTCNVWQESGRTTLLDTLYLNLQADHNFRYVHGAMSYSGGYAQYHYINNDVENLDLNRVLCYITFYNSSGGILRVDNATIANETEMDYLNGTAIELVAIVEGNSTFGFINFTWDSGSNISNPYSLTIPSNLTVWTYFYNITTTPCAEETGTGAGAGAFKPSPLVLIERELGTPFWRLWLLGDVTPNGIIASILLGVLIVLGFRILQSLRKKRKLKIAKIKFS